MYVLRSEVSTTFLIVPDRRRYALPVVGVTGAGSRAVPKASVRDNRPAAEFSAPTLRPNASIERLNREATGWTVSRR